MSEFKPYKSPIERRLKQVFYIVATILFIIGTVMVIYGHTSESTVVGRTGGSSIQMVSGIGTISISIVLAIWGRFI